MVYSCDLSIAGKNATKILDFTFPVLATVTPAANSANSTLIFVLTDAKRQGEKINFNTYKYKLANEKLAEYYIDQSITSVTGTVVFGSGLPISKFTAPKIDLEDAYLVVYEA